VWLQRYFSEHQGRVFRANPGLKLPQISTLIAAEYRALPSVEKSALVAKAAGELDSWHKAVDAWKVAHPHQSATRVQRSTPSMHAITEQVKDEMEKKKQKAKAAAESKKKANNTKTE
jgi:hypothetical protein